MDRSRKRSYEITDSSDEAAAIHPHFGNIEDNDHIVRREFDETVEIMRNTIVGMQAQIADLNRIVSGLQAKAAKKARPLPAPTPVMPLLRRPLPSNTTGLPQPRGLTVVSAVAPVGAPAASSDAASPSIPRQARVPVPPLAALAPGTLPLILPQPRQPFDFLAAFAPPPPVGGEIGVAPAVASTTAANRAQPATPAPPPPAAAASSLLVPIVAPTPAAVAPTAAPHPFSVLSSFNATGSSSADPREIPFDLMTVAAVAAAASAVIVPHHTTPPSVSHAPPPPAAGASDSSRVSAPAVPAQLASTSRAQQPPAPVFVLGSIVTLGKTSALGRVDGMRPMGDESGFEYYVSWPQDPQFPPTWQAAHTLEALGGRGKRKHTPLIGSPAVIT